MKYRHILTSLMLVFSCWLSATPSLEDFRFLLDKEQFQLIQKYESDFLQLSQSPNLEERQILLEYAQRTNQMDLAMNLHYQIARDFGSLEDALQWLILQSILELDPDELRIQHGVLSRSFYNTADSLIFAYYSLGEEDQDILSTIQTLTEYNDVIEASAKALVDEIAIQTDSNQALETVATLYETYPHSKWHQAAYYYQLYHLSQLKDYTAFEEAVSLYQNKSAAHAYITALFKLSPTLRRDYAAGEANLTLLKDAQRNLEVAAQAQSAFVLFDHYEDNHWQNKVRILDAKARYYLELALIAPKGLFGDEEDLFGLLSAPDQKHKEFLASLDEIEFENNNQGEQAELYFWKARSKALFDTSALQESALRDFGQCLILGAPRKRYDNDALNYISQILRNSGSQEEALDYIRKIFDYDGIIFETTQSFANKNYMRAALADYDNDGLIDILFNGKYIYHNDGDFVFTPHPDEFISQNLNSSGGIWADFNKDGLLDFVSISHSDDGSGEALMKQNLDHSFVKVNPKAGDIDDQVPSEGVAFVDIDGKGYPSIYIANYELWQISSGFPDRFWYNDEGSFRDESYKRGFLSPAYADNPGLPGRGVAPADFDNDGKQEILVTNYRLNRNFLFKQADSIFVDLAALYGVAGQYKNGYYGHSIGADWGDIDNDGDLDLIIANLAHPRFIDISDTTILFRNDGLQHRIVEADTLYYWQFTDITENAGITYDELHAEPLFFDADNDGDLDLFISTVYENERSYLYRNDGNSTFTDITFLSGARVYNGWSCATGDLDRDGLLDLVIGSANGTKVLKNNTQTENRALYLKPIYKGPHIDLLPVSLQMPDHPNSPAFGTRVKLKLVNPNGNSSVLIRELSSAKGSSTQNAPELHFGLGNAEIISFELWN
nr:hypothetical protein [Candidatus Cloacimonadota bacterium]